jgi:nitrite reductase/ring-hydroxylating ferredoxin subunit
MNDRTGWHPLALSHAIEPGSSAGARLFGDELAVWRDSDGVAHIWEDRCPHRGMKLSFGFVRGHHIACLYHGWQYDRAGICQYIPAHPDLAVPETIRVPVYPTEERGGMIWTTLEKNPAPLPAIGADAVPVRSLYLDCDVDTAVAALGQVRLTPFGSDGLADTHVDRLMATLFTVNSAAERLLIGIQVISQDRIALHVTIPGVPAIYQGAGQSHYLRWALSLRRLIEQGFADQPADLHHGVASLEPLR